MNKFNFTTFKENLELGKNYKISPVDYFIASEVELAFQSEKYELSEKEFELVCRLILYTFNFNLMDPQKAALKLYNYIIENNYKFSDLEFKFNKFYNYLIK